jgi:hypothetical protein
MWLRAENFAGTVTDLDTGEQLRHVSAVDAEAGLVEVYQVDAGGKVLRDVTTGKPIVQLGRGRFKADLRRRVDVPRKRAPRLGAPTCSRCPSRMTLPGDDLCPVCRAREQGRTVGVKPLGPGELMAVRPCDNGCGREATWSVGDEVSVTPVPGTLPRQHGGPPRPVLFLRGATVARRWYCSWCYQPPRLLDARGEVVEVREEAGGCRP